LAKLNKWTDDELKAALRAYLQVLASEQTGTVFSPTLVHRALIAGPLAGRNEGSVARRMSNISSVMVSAGEPWVTRYKPDFDHVGTNVSSIILRLLGDLRLEAQQETSDVATLETRAATLMAQGKVPKPKGAANPAKRSGTSTVYARSPDVVAWVLQEANGICDACTLPAPFISAAGRPYLEVHHVKRLADGGPDIVENAVALCPNCHRRLHHSVDAKSHLRALMKRCSRLIAF
jgi:5-methylcytosine-specific restriction protein A